MRHALLTVTLLGILLARQATLWAQTFTGTVSEADSTEIAGQMLLFNYLHATVTLPTATSDGTELTWSLETTVDGYVSQTGSTLTVSDLPSGEPLVVGTLTVSIGEEGALCTKALQLAPDDDRYGYLYCYMSSASEITNYALGTQADKGHVFYELLEGGEIFDTDVLAPIETGTRDAYLLRGEGDDGYFIATTDMSNAISGVWTNHGIDLMHSPDLIHWTSVPFDFNLGKSLFSDPSATTGYYDTDEEYANITRVWAPQTIYDPDYNDGEGGYLVYYSILSTNDGDDYDRIYYSYADRAMETLTQPRLLFDPGISVIDADIIFNPYDSLYHMYYKREGATSSERGIYEATSPVLIDGEWTDVLHVTNEGTQQVEGSSTIRRINEDVYNLYYMRYSGGSAYKYCETDYLCLNPTSSSALDGEGDFQHGSFITVTETEYTMLQSWSDLSLLLPTVTAVQESLGTGLYPVLDAAVAQAETALSLTDVASLASALPAAYQALSAAYASFEANKGDILDSLCNSLSDGDEADLTWLVENPTFDGNSGDGWSGTDFTATSSGVAEFWNKTYDTYQVLTDMPAGIYRLEASGFYRNGSIEVAYSAHTAGTEELLAQLYLNDSTASFMSLYDESIPYTYSPSYTYPDGVSGANTAFNTDSLYGGNAVSCTLSERGDLTVGLRKTTFVSYDWNCFDNIRLYYSPLPSDEDSSDDDEDTDGGDTDNGATDDGDTDGGDTDDEVTDDEVTDNGDTDDSDTDGEDTDDEVTDDEVTDDEDTDDEDTDDGDTDDEDTDDGDANDEDTDDGNTDDEDTDDEATDDGDADDEDTDDGATDDDVTDGDDVEVEPDAIVSTSDDAAANNVYTLQGTCLGTSIEDLPAGIYVIGGQKIIIK